MDKPTTPGRLEELIRDVSIKVSFFFVFLTRVGCPDSFSPNQTLGDGFLNHYPGFEMGCNLKLFFEAEVVGGRPSTDEPAVTPPNLMFDTRRGHGKCDFQTSA